LIVLIILNIIILPLAAAVLNFTYAQQNVELHEKTLDYLYVKPPNSKLVAHIATGNTAMSLGVDPFAHRVYVANYDDNTVSVINASSDKEITRIPVGTDPTAVDVDPSTNTIYVADSVDNGVSIIDAKK